MEKVDENYKVIEPNVIVHRIPKAYNVSTIEELVEAKVSMWQDGIAANHSEESDFFVLTEAERTLAYQYWAELADRE